MFPLVNLNGNLVSKSAAFFGFDHPAITGSEIIQEKLRLFQGDFLFAERHYFHLMANMRMARMNIPMSFTPDFFYAELNKLIEESNLENALFTFNVCQNFHTTDFWISARVLTSDFLFKTDFEIDQYRETHVDNGFHQRIHFTEPHKSMLRIFAVENELSDLILLNEQKFIARAIEGNIFVIKDNKLSTPKLEDGAFDDVLRSRILHAGHIAPHFDQVKEENIFPFALMQADEVFIAVNGEGIYSVSRFRKKSYTTEITTEMLDFILENQE